MASWSGGASLSLAKMSGRVSGPDSTKSSIFRTHRSTHGKKAKPTHIFKMTHFPLNPTGTSTSCIRFYTQNVPKQVPDDVSRKFKFPRRIPQVALVWDIFGSHLLNFED